MATGYLLGRHLVLNASYPKHICSFFFANEKYFFHCNLGIKLDMEKNFVLKEAQIFIQTKAPWFFLRLI